MPTPIAPSNLTYSLTGGVLAIDTNSPLLKSVDTSKLTITAPLTNPFEPDKAGDFVHPEGGNFAPHEKEPWVGLEHFRWHKSEDSWIRFGDAGYSNDPVIVAWSRESLAEPGGKYGVRLVKGLDYEGKKVDLPISTSWFDAGDKLSSQVFALVADDSLPGVSPEMNLGAPKVRDGRLVKSYRELGKSPIENRPAYELFNWDLLAYAFCRTPINEGALTVTKSDQGSASSDKLIKAIQLGRIGSEAMHPLLLKSLSGAVPERKYWTTALEKAMPDESQATTSVYDDQNSAAGKVDTNGQSEFPTADALYTIAQGITDLCSVGLESNGEHKKGRKVIAKICAKLEALSQEAVAAAENVEADLNDEEDGDVAPTDDEAAAVDTSKDSDGVMKCLPERVKILLKAKRFTLKEIQTAEVGDSPEDKAALEKALRRFKRAEAMYS